MDYLPKSTTVQKHFHYHYHYEVNDVDMTQPIERYSSPSSKINHSSPSKDNWKGYINPEVTKLYDQISVHESFDETFTPKASRLNQNRLRDYPHSENQAQSKRLPRSRVQLLQDIQVYEKYLKEHSEPNLYVPNTPIIYKGTPKTDTRLVSNKCASLNDLFLERKPSNRRNLQSIVTARTESRMASTKQEASTVFGTERQQESELNFTARKIINPQKYVRQSEIKSPTSSNNIFQKAKIRMSYIDNTLHLYQAEQLENSSFSLFQRQAQKESSPKNSDVLYKPLKSNVQSEKPMQGDENKEDQLSYRYELMREECEFLRNKYIEHAEKSHQVKF